MGIEFKQGFTIFETTPRPTPSVTPSVTPTSASMDPTPTTTPTVTVTTTPTNTPTSSVTPTVTTTPSNSVTPTTTPTNTPTNTTTPTNTVTPTVTVTPTATSGNGLLVNLDSGDLSSYPTSGSTWSDLIGTNNSATLTNTPTYSSNYNGILNFNHSSLEYGTISNIGNLSNWTVEVWFRLTTSLTGKVTSIVSNVFNGSNLNFSIGTNNQPSNANLAVGFYNGAWRTTAGFVPATNVWYQVVGTYDGSTIRQYVNGNLSGGTLNYVGTPTSGGDIRLMRRWDDTLTASNFVNGDLSIVKIYNRAISGTEILQNYNDNYTRFVDPTPTPTVTPTNTVTPTTTPTPTNTVTPTPTSSIITSNLVLYFDPSNPSSYPGSGTTITDLSGNGMNGTMSNITFTSPYFSYNGTNSQVAITDNALLEPGSGDWTMEVWVNQTNSGNDVVLGKFDPGGGAQDVSYSIRTTGTNYYAQIGSGTGSGATLYQNSTTHAGSINTWYQIVYVLTNVATNTFETFVNGSSIGSVSHSLASLLNTPANLYLGSYNNGEFAQWFDGKIGITRLYNRALTSSEVLQNYNANKSKYGL